MEMGMYALLARIQLDGIRCCSCFLDDLQLQLVACNPTINLVCMNDKNNTIKLWSGGRISSNNRQAICALSPNGAQLEDTLTFPRMTALKSTTESNYLNANRFWCYINHSNIVLYLVILFYFINYTPLILHYYLQFQFQYLISHK